LGLGVIVVASAIGLASASPAWSGGADGGSTAVDAREPPAQAPPRDGITVVATDSNVWLADEGAGPRQSSELIAYGPDGDRIYYDGSHDRYWDVDPSPLGDRTVLYTASDHLNGSECNASTACTRNVVERANLSTGEVTRLYERVTPHKHATRWHDADRLDDDRVVVADIYRDAVFVVNVTTGLVEWEWTALNDFDPETGGPFPRDWTHLNDVEVLDDGRFMVSLRNQDRVVFLDRQRGLIEEWTLNDQANHSVLFRQHNPDFLPAENGGPAVVVADSENDRLVEYQRVDGEWQRTWRWADARLQWPRDADRLPNGNTLIADSVNHRVVEVTPDGEVVWEFEPENSRVFDVEALANGNVLVSVATKVPGEDCPDEHLEIASDTCVHNRVLELEKDTKEVVWKHTWYDAYVTHHEVHDADRLENGETAIIDMGNNRVFTVDQQGEITWEWDAEKHLGEGSEFDEEYGSPEKEGPESDWTHMNDVDGLSDGRIQLSIRNFDVVIVVDRETNEIVDVVGAPGEKDFLNEQHDPNRIEREGTLLVADSDNNRLVEIDLATEERGGASGDRNWMPYYLGTSVVGGFLLVLQILLFPFAWLSTVIIDGLLLAYFSLSLAHARDYGLRWIGAIGR
jgi:uncharacterized protein (UPF0248 family)